MNESHKLGKLKNRLNRCKKRLTVKELTSEQRLRISQRLAELEAQLNKK
jgi:hypothetical protein